MTNHHQDQKREVELLRIERDKANEQVMSDLWEKAHMNDSLRREIESLRAALDEETNTRQVYGEQIRELLAERDALLAALKLTLPYLPEKVPGHEYIKPKILAAIKEAEG